MYVFKSLKEDYIFCSNSWNTYKRQFLDTFALKYAVLSVERILR